MPIPDPDTCYRAMQARDARFDGQFVPAVRTTGIYCRPSCPARTPRRENVEFHPSAAAAQRHGFRACRRCRPDAAPGSADWDVRGDVAGRALRLIADGVVDRDGVDGLAHRLGYSSRQLVRTLRAEVGAGPLALARARRAQTARVLLETTTLPASDVAFAAGFASIRQFNQTLQEVFAASPTALRSGRHRSGSGAGAAAAGEPGRVALRLPYRAPHDVAATLRFHGVHAVAGVETWDGTTFTRTLRLPHGAGRVALRPGGGAWVAAALDLADLRDLPAAVSRTRALLDLDADPAAVDAALSADPALAPLVAARPGLRSPGAIDGPELAVRTVVGQQVSLAGARTVLGRIVAAHGEAVFPDAPTHLFPAAATLADLDPAELPLPRARARAVVAVSAAVAAGDLVLDPGADRAATRRALLTLPGIGPWTADYLRMRALHDPDVLLAGDLAVRRIAERLGLDLTVPTPGATGRDTADPSGAWAPWRSYVTHHLWALALADLP